MTIMETRPAAEVAAGEMQQLLAALVALRRGDAEIRLPMHGSGVAGRVADAFNDVVEQNASMAEEFSRLRQVVGKEGRLEQRASLREARGFRAESIDRLNSLIDDLVHPTPTIDIVLMDIVMPERDGLATMQEIRKRPRGRELPMVAVTAKAMKGDRQKCIEAGARDDISKPVDPRHLLALPRGWLCR